MKKLLKEDYLINLFHPKSCTIFISLLKPYGKIKRITNTVFNVFGYHNKELIDKNIT